MAVEYDFYVSDYKSDSIPQAEWDSYESKAEAQLNRYKRIYTVTAPEDNSEDMAICAMADVMYLLDQVGTGAAYTSSSIGSVSSSFGSGSIDLSPKGQSAQLYRAASLYLDIYRGVS